eukprot:768384-Hanusia_phi.AAC.2
MACKTTKIDYGWPTGCVLGEADLKCVPGGLDVNRPSAMAGQLPQGMAAAAAPPRLGSRPGGEIGRAGPGDGRAVPLGQAEPGPRAAARRPRRGPRSRRDAVPVVDGTVLVPSPGP